MSGREVTITRRPLGTASFFGSWPTVSAFAPSVSFTVPGPPVPFQRTGGGATRARFTPPRSRAYRSAVAWAARAALPSQWSRASACSVTVVAFMPDRKVRDVDNFGKNVLDACTGVVWDDDAQVVDLLICKRWDYDAPRTEVHVMQVATVAPERATKPKARKRRAVKGE